MFCARRRTTAAVVAGFCLLSAFAQPLSAHPQTAPRCLAYATVESLPLQIEQYEGTAYFYLNNGDLKFTIEAPPGGDCALDLLWGAKQDERSAAIMVNGQRQTITAGGYNGFRWTRVPLPPRGDNADYRVTLSKATGRVGFVAAVRVVPADVPVDAPLELPKQNLHITFQLPEMQDGWPAVESFAGLPVLERHGLQARRALLQSQLFVEGWLAKADPKTGLIPENLGQGIDRWNGRNNAADNYAFMVLTAALTDRPLFDGRMLDMLRTEERLTSRVDRLGDYYKFSTSDFEFEDVDMNRLIFDNSEYVKDGLMPITEWLGPSPWLQRMSGIIDDIWKRGSVDTPGGRIPSTNPEVNGEMMQLTSRYFWMTGQRKYLDYAIRIADWYLLGEHHPTRNGTSLRLRDHGCELVSGLTEVYFACSYADKDKASQYREPLHAILDCILQYGINEHGMMFNEVNPQTGAVIHGGLSDNWGYNYNGFYTVFLVDGEEKYRDAVRHALKNLDQCKGYAWEGTSHDGYADSIESAINLQNREPSDVAAEWIDSQMRIMLAMQADDGIIGGWHGDGNFARTAIMYALWKQQGVTIQPWRADLRLGAFADDGILRLLLSADQPWEGRLVFDPPRHKTIMHTPLDYPRINQFPEWYTVEAERSYRVAVSESEAVSVTGQQLLDGWVVKLSAPSHPLQVTVTGVE